MKHNSNDISRKVSLAIVKGTIEGGKYFEELIDYDDVQRAKKYIGVIMNQEKNEIIILRILFYQVFFAEIERLKDQGYKQRLAVKQTCDQINECFSIKDSYDKFMKTIESRTRSITERMVGIRTGSSDKVSIGFDKGLLIDFFGARQVSYYLEDYEPKLTAQEESFIYQVSFKSIIHAHTKQ